MPDTTDDPGSSLTNEEVRLYDREFWIAYLANFLLTTLNSLTFRLGDFVHFLGGTEATTGLIWGLATGGSVLVRILLGSAIDRRGTRLVWVWSAVVLVVSLAGFVPLSRIGPAIYFLRLIYCCSIAGVFSASIVHIAARVPPVNRAEILGSLGSSGFIGMLIGPWASDVIKRAYPASATPYRLIFGLSAVLAVMYLALVFHLMRDKESPRSTHRVPLVPLLVRHWPGMLVLVSMMMGLAQVVPFTFLTRFAMHRHLGGIAIYFAFYAPTAFALRIFGRRWPETVGRGLTTVIGLACLTVGMLLYLPVRSSWHLMWPALASGVGHAFLFPSVTTLAAERFPEQFRATGTSFILSFIDVGTLVAAPAFGFMIDHHGFSLMFISASLTIGTVAVLFGFSLFAATTGVEEGEARPTEIVERSRALAS